MTVKTFGEKQIFNFRIMNIVAGKMAFAKLGIIAAITALVAVLELSGDSLRASASAFGPSPSHTDAPMENNCTSCHSDSAVNSGSGELVISGVPGTYTAGQQIAVTVRLSQSDAVIYGFQMTAVDGLGQGSGIFTIPTENPSRMQILTNHFGGPTLQDRQYVEHTVDGLSNGQFGFNSWTFTWTAPAQTAGKVDFYLAGNAGNSDGGMNGDYIYTTTASSLPAAAGVTVSGRVFTSSGLALRNARVILTDQNNLQRFATTSSFGVYSFTGVQTGSYTLSAQSKRYRFSPKLLSVASDLANQDFTGLE